MENAKRESYERIRRLRLEHLFLPPALLLSPTEGLEKVIRKYRIPLRMLKRESVCSSGDQNYYPTEKVNYISHSEQFKEQIEDSSFIVLPSNSVSLLNFYKRYSIMI